VAPSNTQTAPQVQHAAGSAQAPPVNSKSAILRQRAVALAKAVDSSAEHESRVEFLEFSIAYELYGLTLELIQEVTLLRDYARMPCTPRYILGVINLRGRMVSILDLRQLFGLPRKGLTYQNKVIVLRDQSMTIGLLGDELRGVRTLAASRLQPPLPTHSGKQLEYLKGLTPDGTALLDAAKVLSDKELIVQDAMERLSR
jgi:purine-binding chemotaxis protein CheW